MKPATTRRAFLQTAACAFPTIVPSYVLGLRHADASQSMPPSERVHMGFVGVGSMGTGHLRGTLQYPDVRVTAICDVRDAHRERAKTMVDRHYGDHACKVHNDFREFMARTDVDAVLIATPEHWHPLIGMEAARRGKHMYYEKPMSVCHADAVSVREEVLRHGVIFQFGTQQRSSHYFRHACELARNGYIGEVKKIYIGSAGGGKPDVVQAHPGPVPAGFDYDMWLGPAPWSPYSDERVSRAWMMIHDYGLGSLSGAWGIHDVDFAQWANDTDSTGPIDVEAEGQFYEDIRDVMWSWTAEHKYRNGVTLVHMDLATAKKRVPQFQFGSMATVIEGSKGWIWVSRQGMRTHPADLVQTAIRADGKRVAKYDDHRRNFLDAVRTGRPALSPVTAAVRAEAICQQADIAMRLRRKLRWNPETERFVDDDAANRMLSRPMRSPWRV
ncbi:MAG: Gfo/Idh/MocA family oxidoreductase [Bryobacterales bacterium]|nr:Gfo/Idh/MocA family oxidoreductase [Bryobacterales bacterium]